MPESARQKKRKTVFADLLKRHPNSPELHLLWGQVYASVAQIEAAEEEFKEALRLNSASARRSLLIWVYYI